MSFPLLRNEAGVAGLLGRWWGEGSVGSKLHPGSCSPGEGHFSATPGRLCVLGPTYGSGEGFLGRISTQGGKGRLVTIPVVWGTPEKLLWSGGQPHRNRVQTPILLENVF